MCSFGANMSAKTQNINPLKRAPFLAPQVKTQVPFRMKLYWWTTNARPAIRVGLLSNHAAHCHSDWSRVHALNTGIYRSTHHDGHICKVPTSSEGVHIPAGNTVPQAKYMTLGSLRRQYSKRCGVVLPLKCTFIAPPRSKHPYTSW